MTDENPMREALGKALIAARARANISRPQLSRRLPLNEHDQPRSTATIWQWESGRRWPHQTDLAAYAALNSETVEDLWAAALVILDADATRRALASLPPGPQDTS